MGTGVHGDLREIRYMREDTPVNWTETNHPLEDLQANILILDAKLGQIIQDLGGDDSAQIADVARVLTDLYTNASGSQMTEGQLVYITTTANEVNLADASSDTIASRYIAVVYDETVDDTAEGEFATYGKVNVRFAAGLTLTPGEEVYMSAATPGSATNVAPVASGNVRQCIGYIASELSYDGSTDFLALVRLKDVARSVV